MNHWVDRINKMLDFDETTFGIDLIECLLQRSKNILGYLPTSYDLEKQIVLRSRLETIRHKLLK